jgi:hypothetical protein
VRQSDHIQLDELRTVIPQIVRSVAIPHPTPSSLHSAFKSAAWGGSRSIDVFKTAWNAEETQTLFAKSRKSKQENQDLDWETASAVPKYGWIEQVNREKEEKSKEIKVEETEAEERPLTIDEQRRLVEEYRDKHSGFQMSWDEDVMEIKVSLLLWSNGLFWDS